MNQTKNKHNLSRNIPPAVAREVRKRCGFGCVVCGNAFYQYDHFDPEFADAVEHRPDRIALLCPEHHAKKGGLLTEEAYELARESPAAIKKGFAETEWISDNSITPEILFGALTFCEGTSIIKVDNEVVLGFEFAEEAEQPPMVKFRAFDRKGVEAIAIYNNEIRAINEAFDIENVKSKWTVRSKLGDIDLVLEFNLPTRITVERLKFTYGRWGINLNGSVFKLTFDESPVITIQGIAKVKGSCLYSLASDAPKIESRDLTMTFGSGPSPLGTIPIQGGFRMNWPVYVLKSISGDFTITERDNHSILSVYTRRQFASDIRKEDEEIIECSKQFLLITIGTLGSKKLIDMVGFNFGCDSITQARPWEDFMKTLAFS